MKKHIQHYHPLVTRRDFLSQGLISFSAAAFMPTLLGQAVQKFAVDCGGDATSNAIPFMVFDMAGGASLPGNFLVGKKGGPEDFLPKYDLLGWNPRESGALNTDFGLPMSAKYSQLLKGILQNSSAQARQNFRMGSICHAALDDTSTNKMNAAPLILTAGARGTYITNGLGTVDSKSGGNSAPVFSSDALKPVFVKGINDILGSTSFGGASFKDFKPSQKKAMAVSGVALSEVQKTDYIAQPDGPALADLSQCAYQKSLSFLQSVEGLDPRGDQITQGVYQINQNTAPTDENAVAAGLAMNTLKGNSGPSSWTLGDCDYHTGSQTKGDMRDLQMGVQIGKALELAFQMKKPFVFQLITDGGCDASPGTRNWSGDTGAMCMTVMGYYNPKAAPKMKRMQIGYYTDGQVAERNTLVGNEPALAGYAVLANYLNIAGRLADFNTLAPGVFNTPSQLESVLLFEEKS